MQLWRRKRVGQHYIIDNKFVGVRDFFAPAVAESGIAMPTLTPYRVAYAIARVAGTAMKLMRRKDSMVSPKGVYLANVFRAVDSGKARRELGWNPRPLAETVCDAIRWLADSELSMG